MKTLKRWNKNWIRYCPIQSILNSTLEPVIKAPVLVVYDVFWCTTSSFLKNLFVRPHVNDKRESVLKKSASWTFFENLSLCWLCCSKGAPFICSVKRRKTLRFKKIPGWHVDEVLETTSVDRGRPHSFSQSILFECVSLGPVLTY